MKVLLDLNRERGTTLIIVTHDPEIAEQTERIIQIRDGVVEKITNGRKKAKTKGKPKAGAKAAKAKKTAAKKKGGEKAVKK
jgi:ABC-type lipoprotein export system ATPase subunit